MTHQGEEDSEYIIRRIFVPHCARGPQRCEKCKNMAEEKKICLLQIYLHGGEITRPMLEIEKDGKKQWFEFDIRKIFNDEIEANTYAKEHGIPVLFPLI